MDRLCLDCGTPVKGRTDKKFCDDSCRNNYNNHLKVEDNLILKRVNGILKKNRAILAQLTPGGKAKVTRKRLLAAGFNFDYHTYSYTAQNGNIYIFCYEYGYLVLNEDSFLLVKREEKLWLV
jgi:predicted nucleic acid-binding Zn ribbon protein